MQLLLKGHEGVVLSQEDMARLATWMDANALFYGSFDPVDQKRQQLGERIAGPAGVAQRKQFRATAIQIAVAVLLEAP